MKKVAFHTFGCKLNFAESSTISRQFTENDYALVDFHEKADVYVIHSCTVTANAERKTISAIRQAQRLNPDARIAVIGCMAELNAEKLRSIEGVDLVLGNSDKFKLTDFLDDVDQKPEEKKTEEFIPSWSVHERTRSFLKIQDGCDYFCAYCTIPLARGRSRSDTINNTLAIAKEMVNNGVREIVLTGINIGDFGRHQNESLLLLLEKIEKIDGLERIRISSIEPDLLDDHIIELFAASEKLMPHFHIPLQSGSDKMLKKMNRKYNKVLFAGKVSQIKKLIPHCCIATDLIVGFPGETDEIFKESFEFVKSLDLSYMHVFTYSERKDTAAFKIEETVPIKIRKERSKAMHQLSEEKKKIFYNLNTGKKANVFFESENKNGYLYGFTENYIRARHTWRKELTNSIVEVELTALCEEEVFDTMLSE
jgi:threonylcarbamoyladenosine tRNA methylthiotransferase MtaB